jgi:hypothetical protein
METTYETLELWRSREHSLETQHYARSSEQRASSHLYCAFYVHVCSLARNDIGPEGERAIAEAIAANEDTALIRLFGVELFPYRDVLGITEEDGCRDNEAILRHRQQSRLARRVKSARSGARRL